MKELKNYINEETQKLIELTSDMNGKYYFICGTNEYETSNLKEKLEYTLKLMLENGFTDTEIYRNSRIEKITKSMDTMCEFFGVPHTPIALGYCINGIEI